MESRHLRGEEEIAPPLTVYTDLNMKAQHTLSGEKLRLSVTFYFSLANEAEAQVISETEARLRARAKLSGG